MTGVSSAVLVSSRRYAARQLSDTGLELARGRHGSELTLAILVVEAFSPY